MMPLSLWRLHDQLKYNTPYYTEEELKEHLLRIIKQLLKERYGNDDL